jgi:hypothetical protein
MRPASRVFVGTASSFTDTHTMRNETENPFARSLPPMSAAMADIMIAATQRTFALNAAMLREVVSRGADSSQEAASSPREALSAWPATLSQPVTAEQMWRYGASMLTICQWATASVAQLLGAQGRGADDEIEAISRQVRDEVADATASAAAVAGSVMSDGLAAVTRIAETSAQAGAAAGAEAGGIVEDAVEATAGSNGGGRDRPRAGGRAH